MSSYRKELIKAIMEKDPAARSSMEVRLLYPGYKALVAHLYANWCFRHNLKLIARWISERAKRKTGIEIHPAARIGRGVLIDHGMGVVIGETAEVGDGCIIYQGVTLGGTGKDTGKRHPTIGKNVLIGAGAKVLGPFTVGDNSRIAAGAVVLREVPANVTAVGVPARVVRVAGMRPSNELDQIHYADPVALDITRLQDEINRLYSMIEMNGVENTDGGGI